MENLKGGPESVGLFIDDSNLLNCLKTICADGSVDYIKLRDSLVAGRLCLYSYIYMAGSLPRNRSKAKLRYFLEQNDFIVRHKKAKEFESPVLKQFKCDFDVEITIDVMDIIYQGFLPDTFIFVTGDSDIQPLIKRVNRAGSRVEVVSSYFGLAKELKEFSDSYQFLQNMWPQISRDQQKRPA